jgi:outer membrane lipoprotein carrier protein
VNNGRIRTALVAVAAAAFVLNPFSVEAATPTAKSVAQRVQRVYDKTKTFQAEFKQTYRVKVQNVKKVSKGQLAFAKPGKISFRYTKPEGNRVVSDGKTIKIYQKQDQQMFLSRVSKSQYPAALAFLLGEGRLIRDFDLKLLDAVRMKVENGYVLSAVPRKGTPAYKKLLLYVDGPSAQVRRVLVLDAQGNRNRFDFIRPVVNKKLDAKEFSFTAPKGTNIIKP